MLPEVNVPRILIKHVFKKESGPLQHQFKTREGGGGLREVKDKYYLKYFVTILEDGCRFLYSEKMLLVMTEVSTSKRGF